MHQKWGMVRNNVGDTTMHPLRSVLILEDDDSLLSLFLKVLQRAGYEACSATDEAQAQSLMTQKPFDVAVIDLSVSGNLIFDFIAELRSQQPKTIILLISGYTPDEITQRAHQMQVEVMEKPFVPDELVSRINSLLSARAA